MKIGDTIVSEDGDFRVVSLETHSTQAYVRVEDISVIMASQNLRTSGSRSRGICAVVEKIGASRISPRP